jgi:hypothetical protein
MCFGGSSDNSAMINEQKQEAADTRAKEDARQARVNAAIAKVKAAFEGQPTYSTSTTAGPGYRVSNAAAGTQTGAAVPGMSGYTYRMTTTPGKSAAAQTGYASQGGYQGAAGRGSGGATYGTGYAGGAATTPSTTTTQVVGPDGKVYNAGDLIPTTTTTQTQTGTTGGFDDAFYNKYRDAITGYYLPQVADQYKLASEELAYRLARAGQLRSSTTNTEYTDLAKQNELNKANIASKADTATGELRKSVASQESAAENAVYAAEDPDVAANQSLAAVRNISASTPDLSPLASVFNLASIGGANALKGYYNQQNYARAGGYNTSGAGASRVIT